MEDSPVSAPSVVEVEDDSKEAEGRNARLFVDTGSSEVLDEFLKEWMASSVVRKARIWDVVFPGSHDSATYMSTHSQALERGGVVFQFVKSFVETQEKNVYDQLACGIRYLDLRVCVDPLGQPQCAVVPYCAHGGYRCAPLREVLEDVRKFLEERSTEIVILALKADSAYTSGPYHMSLGVADFWVSVILGCFLGNRLTGSTTIQQLSDRGQQVIYFYEQVERYMPDDVEATNFRMKCSMRLSTKISLLESEVIPRNPPIEPRWEKNKVIRYNSVEYHKRPVDSRDTGSSDFDFLVDAIKANVMTPNVAWTVENASLSAPFTLTWPCGILECGEGFAGEKYIFKTRLPCVRPVKLKAHEAKRFLQCGIDGSFFRSPVIAQINAQFIFASNLRTNYSILTKSWGQTCENNPRFIGDRLRYWVQKHGRSIPRPAYQFRVLSAEITPPAPSFPIAAHADLIKFWASQTTNALLALPTGVKPNALECNKSVIRRVLDAELVNKVNCITHDYVSKRLVLTILFHHLRFLKAPHPPDNSPDFSRPPATSQFVLHRPPDDNEQPAGGPASTRRLLAAIPFRIWNPTGKTECSDKSSREC